MVEKIFKYKKPNLQGITVEERKTNILRAFDKFYKHILTPRPPGSVLNNLQCLGVAKCAQEAVFCKSCDTLPSSVCWRPGTDFYAWISKRELSKIDADGKPLFLPSSDTSDEKVEFLIHTIHAIVRHQHRLDKNWYKKTLTSIASIFLCPNENVKDMDDEGIQIRCHQIFCEIVTILATSSLFHTLFLAFGESIPKLPDEEAVQKVSYTFNQKEFNILSFLHKVRRDPTVSDWSPFFISKDINLKSKECKEMNKSDLDFLIKECRAKFPPRVAIHFAPVDSKIMSECVDSIHMGPDRMNNLGTFSDKCGGFTRFQMETITSAYTSALDCAY